MQFLQKITNPLDTISWLIVGALSLMTEFLHCTVPATGDVLPVGTCSVPDWLSGVSPQIVVISGIVFGGLTMVAKWLRPGGFLRGWFGSTAVVVPTDSSHSTVGTATPEHVATP